MSNVMLYSYCFLIGKLSCPISPAIRLPVQGDGHQREDTDVDTQDLHSGAKLAHKSRQIPTLKQSSMELKGNSEKSYGHVSKGQVRNIHVRDSSHPSVRKIHNLSL